MPSLELLGASVDSGSNRSLLTNLDCRFPAGEFTVITGQNGSGKSLLLRVLSGSFPLSDGKMMWGTKKIRSSVDLPTNLLIIIPQNPSGFFVTNRIEDEISLGLSLLHVEKAKLVSKVEEGLRWAQLESRKHDSPTELSFCEQRIAALACAFVQKPQYILIDDPLSSLDRNNASRVIEKLVSLRASGIGIIMTCQDIERILAHADRLILLKQGRILADALPERVLPFLEAHGVRKPNLKLEEMSWLLP